MLQMGTRAPPGSIDDPTDCKHLGAVHDVAFSSTIALQYPRCPFRVFPRTKPS
jgi:hypothetical protein